MPRHEPLPDEAIEMRSVLMRLYHSRQLGEEFYPAAFVNGHAPQMERDGWIEWCGQGWRMTDVGLRVWAEMNRHILEYKFQYGHKVFDEMREVLKGEDEMSEAVCTVKGCGKPRMISKAGEELTRCEDHMREYWRDQADKKAAKKKAKEKASVDPIAKGFSAVDQAVQGLQQAAARAFPEVTTKLEAMLVDSDRPLPMDECESVERDCEHCEAKAIIGMLKARSPKLAALIEAMEATQRTAAELGL
jgi:hypothetical protein